MARQSEKALSRRKFTIKLYEDLITPWMEKRLNESPLPRSTRTIICEIFKFEQNIEPPEQLETKKKKKVCAFCPCKLRRMTRKFCLLCSRAICGEHHADLCKVCFENK
ncbi:uncharacterized protein TNCT_354451 [Trichonephila clavata]|uniref:Uncharacterized protein n=1 Tax=Trichonephila clavata TaxID=2740835 RepID=A0A8X6L021_TRICU|nr:uncharacterized protein TNCT_354451 [Trichonephila clavata]